MKPQIDKLEATARYTLFICFADGTEGTLDLSHLAGKGVFKSWDEGDSFFRVFVNPTSGAITWPGEIDIDLYNAYCKINGIKPDQFFNQPGLHASHR